MALGRDGFLVTLGPVQIPMWPRPYVLQIWTLSGTSLGPTYMASEQECEEARAALGSQFRSECIGALPGGGDWVDVLAAMMEGAAPVGLSLLALRRRRKAQAVG